LRLTGKGLASPDPSRDRRIGDLCWSVKAPSQALRSPKANSSRTTTLHFDRGCVETPMSPGLSELFVRLMPLHRAIPGQPVSTRHKVAPRSGPSAVSHRLDPEATFREFLTPANNDLGNSHLSSCTHAHPHGIPQGYRRDLRTCTKESTEYLSHGPIPVSPTLGACGRSVGCGRSPRHAVKDVRARL
jgi:hypothetical protein